MTESYCYIKIVTICLLLTSEKVFLKTLGTVVYFFKATFKSYLIKKKFNSQIHTSRNKYTINKVKEP